MRSSLKIRDFLNQYQHKLQQARARHPGEICGLEFTSREVGLEREIKLSRTIRK